MGEWLGTAGLVLSFVQAAAVAAMTLLDARGVCQSPKKQPLPDAPAQEPLLTVPHAPGQPGPTSLQPTGSASQESDDKPQLTNPLHVH